MKIFDKLKDNWNKPQKPSRWNNDYVLKNDWIICLIPLTPTIPILFVIGILESIVVLCPVCNNVNLPSWSFYLFIAGIVGLIYLFVSKMLFTYLKGAGLLIYSPKQPNLRDDAQ